MQIGRRPRALPQRTSDSLPRNPRCTLCAIAHRGPACHEGTNGAGTHRKSATWSTSTAPRLGRFARKLVLPQQDGVRFSAIVHNPESGEKRTASDSASSHGARGGPLKTSTATPGCSRRRRKCPAATPCVFESTGCLLGIHRDAKASPLLGGAQSFASQRLLVNLVTTSTTSLPSTAKPSSANSENCLGTAFKASCIPSMTTRANGSRPEPARAHAFR